MNNQSPLIPQGSLLEQKNKGRARAKILILCVLVLHGVGLLALLMQGCGRDTGTSGAGTTNTTSGASSSFAESTTPSNPTPPFAATSNAAPGEAPGAATGTTGAPPAAATTAPPTPPAIENTTPPPVAPSGPAGGSEYKVVKGDTMATIAKKKLHVSLRALTDANPGVDSTKLKIGQTLHVPAPAATTSTGTTGGTAPAPGATSEGPGGTSYTVKSGDNLLKIANQFGVKVKALRAANSLKTDKIRVGQTLKIPAKTAGTTPTGGTSAAGATTGPAPLPGQ